MGNIGSLMLVSNFMVNSTLKNTQRYFCGCMECFNNYELKKKGQILCIAGRDHQIATGAKFLDIMHESYGFSAHLIETMNINVPYTKNKAVTGRSVAR